MTCLICFYSNKPQRNKAKGFILLFSLKNKSERLLKVLVSSQYDFSLYRGIELEFMFVETDN